MNLPAHIDTAEHRATLGRALYAARAEHLIAYAQATTEPRPLDDLLSDKRTPREIEHAAEVSRLDALISEICRVRPGELVDGGLVTAHGDHMTVLRAVDVDSMAGRFVERQRTDRSHVLGITSDDLCHYFGA